MSPSPALGPAFEVCSRAGRAEELRAQCRRELQGGGLGLQLLPGPISHGKRVTKVAFT